MADFFCRLNAPRSTFAQDMTAAEADSMARHVVYWKGILKVGQAAVFGMVADPAGVWGMTIVTVPDLATVQSIIAADPAILAGHGFSYDVFPMPRGIVR
jgi:hypothetical protein